MKGCRNAIRIRVSCGLANCAARRFCRDMEFIMDRFSSASSAVHRRVKDV